MTESVQGSERLAALSAFAQAFVAEYKEKPHPHAVTPGTGCMLCYFVALAEDALAKKPLASLLVSRERLREQIAADPDVACEAGSGVSLPDSGDAPRWVGGAVVLQKAEQPGDPWIPAGTWEPITKADGSRSAMVGCGECGKNQTLTGHTITADGSVTPSLQCSFPPCPWHVYVKLEGWES